MSSNESGASPWEAANVLPPYTKDPNRRGHRWARTLVLATVVVFCFFYGIAVALFMPWLILGLMVPIAILAPIVIWALPDTRTAPTRALWGLLFAYMMCLIMWPQYIAVALPGLPWITTSRLTGAPLALALLISVSTSAEFREQLSKALKSASTSSRC